MVNQTKAQRRDAARAEALAMQKRQQGRERMYRILVLGVLGLFVVGLAVAIWLIFAESQKSGMEKVDAKPAGVVNDTGIPVDENGAAGTLVEGAPQLDVYVDFMCPVCGQFEALNGADITELREAGDVALVLHPVAILDRMSNGSEYSTRSASALAYVAEESPESFMAYHDLLFANQPAENSAGLSDAQLASFAEQAGVSADVAEGISDGTATETYGRWVQESTELASSAEELANPETGGFGTPTVMVDDERFADWSTPGALKTAIAGAGEGADDSGADGDADKGSGDDADKGSDEGGDSEE